MNKIQKVLNEVERLQSELITEKKKGNGSDVDDACILTLQNIKNYIKFVQEEPVSEDVVSVAKQYVDSHVFGNEEDKFTRSVLVDIFCSGANWKERKMMADAIDGKVIANGMGNPILHLWDKGRHLIDKKVKLIVIKGE